ncbi:MAG TPA: hypothetical protein PLD86_10015 [Vicinamibacteria bacterium]|nr:hypothetical protein [Vicinamibacteria bacterium]
MLGIHRALVVLGAGLLVALVVLLVRRAKAKQCILFSAYVSAAGLFTTLILLFPERYSPEAFMVKQGIYDSLLFGMSLELAIRTFAAFSGIAAFVRLILGAAVALSTSLILIVTPASPDYSSFLRFQPGITAAGIWCLAFVGLLIVWYQIPVPAFTRAIILGYVPYLMVFTVYTDLITRLGWGAIQSLNLLNAVAYDAVAAYWVYSAWRKD